jgi:PilZ domain
MDIDTLLEIARSEGRPGPDERRTHERVTSKLVVRIGTKRPTNMGLVHNLSVGGLGIYTRVVYPPGTLVTMVLEPDGPDSTTLSLTGEVRWTRIVHGTSPEAVYEMGCRFIDATPSYLRFFSAHLKANRAKCEEPVAFAPLAESLDSGTDRREEGRLGAWLPIEFVDPPDMAATLTRNITSGGAFIQGGETLKVGAIAIVEVKLPSIDDGEPVRAIARVVHVRNPVSVHDQGGVGLRFLRFYAGGREKLDAYLAGIEASLGVGVVHVASAPPKPALKG